MKYRFLALASVLLAAVGAILLAHDGPLLLYGPMMLAGGGIAANVGDVADSTGLKPVEEHDGEDPPYPF